VLEVNASGGVSAVNVFGADGLVARESGAIQMGLGAGVNSGAAFGGDGALAQVGISAISYLFDPRGNVSECVSTSGLPSTHEIFGAYGAMTVSVLTLVEKRSIISGCAG